MTEYQRQRSALIDEISAAFEGVTRLNGVSLSEAWIIDDYGSDEERAQARENDKDERWQDVPDEDIEIGYSCLSFLDNIGLRYYLPAYMIWVLMNYQDTDSMTPDSAVFALTPGYEPQLCKWALNRYEAFTMAQSTAIAPFLEFLTEHYHDEFAQKALGDYWIQYSTG